MALHKRPPVAPKMPFPGESPTVSLALAAGQMYGLNEKEAAAPKAARNKKKAAAKPARKPSAAPKAKAMPKAKAKSK